MLATMPLNPFDNLLARIKSLLDDTAHPGYGTLTTSADMTEIEVTMKPAPGEDFETFARRVFAYADGAPIEWTIQARQIPLARVTRKLS